MKCDEVCRRLSQNKRGQEHRADERRSTEADRDVEERTWGFEGGRNKTERGSSK